MSHIPNNAFHRIYLRFIEFILRFLRTALFLHHNNNKNFKIMTTTKFEIGNIYEMRFITDADLSVKYICVKRTDKTVKFERFGNPSDVISKKVKVYNNEEYVVTENYSMAPCIKASRLVG